MKRFKINLAVVAILLAATAAFAFKAPVKHTTNPYWQYDGSGATTLPSNYFKLAGGPSCGTNGNICAIMAPEDPTDSTVPEIDGSLSGRITTKDKSLSDVFLHP